MVWLFLVLGAFSLIMLSRRIGRLEDQLRVLSHRLSLLQGDRPEPLEASRTRETPTVEPDYSDKPWPTARKPLPAVKPAPIEIVRGAEPPPIPTAAASSMAATPTEDARAITRARALARQTESEAASPAEPPLKSLEEIVKEKLRALGPKDPNMGWEMALGTYWLPRLGIAAISVAVVFVLALALQKWGPPVRVAIGYGVCAALLALAWRLEKKTPAYSRVLYGGGFALTYFVTFATYFLPFARVFETPYPTLGLLAAIVAGWAAVAQKRRSPTIAMLVTVLGHFTIAVATSAVDEAGDQLYASVAGILALSAGSAFFLLRNGWYYVAAAGLVGSYLNHGFVMARGSAPEEVGVFLLGMGVLTALFLIYALAELFSPERLRREAIPVWFRSIFVTANTAGFLFLGTVLMARFDFTEDYQHVFRYLLALALLGIALAYLRVRAGDPLYNAYMAKGVAVATLGLAAQFSAASLTAWLAVEVAALLYSARRSGLLVTRLLAFIVGVVAFGHGIATVSDMSNAGYSDPGYYAAVANAAITCLGFLAAALIYQWTDWTPRSPRTCRFSDSTRVLLWQLDLVADKPDSTPDLQKPLGGQLFPHVYALAGAVLFIAFTGRHAESGDTLLPLAVFALALTAAAWAFGSLAFDSAAALVLVAEVVTGSIEIPSGISMPVFLGSIASLTIAALACERNYVRRPDGLAVHQSLPGPYVWYGSVIFLAGLFVSFEYESRVAVAALTGGAIVLALLTNVLHAHAMAFGALGLYLWATLHWHAYANEHAAPLGLPLTLAVIVVGLAADRYYAVRRILWIGPVFLVLSWLVTLHHFEVSIQDRWYSPAVAAVGAAGLAYALGFRSIIATTLSVLSAVIASVHAVYYGIEPGLEGLPLYASFVAPAALWIAYERLTAFAERRLGTTLPFPVSGAFIAIATILLLTMLYYTPQLQEYYLTISWTVLAVLLFGLSLLFREKFYRYAGLAVLLLAIVRVVAVDTRELETIAKVSTWAVLGFVLLALGYGYVKALGAANRWNRFRKCPSRATHHDAVFTGGFRNR